MFRNRMATKATSKTAAKKPATRKTAVPKPAVAKSKIAPKKKEAEDKPATKPITGSAPSPKPSPPSRREIESVSLIDEKKPKQKFVDGEVKKKTSMRPPL